MLNSVAELREYAVRQVARILGHEEHANTLGANEADDLLNLFQQSAWRIIEEQMCFIEKEHHFWLIRIANFGQLFEQLREQPEQEGRIEARTVNERRRVEDVYNAASVAGGAHEIFKVERGLAKELLCALTLKHQ